MQETDTNKHPNFFNKEIDLYELFDILLKSKKIILLITTLTSIFGVTYSLSLPNIYESKTLLVPVNPSNSISAGLSGYGGIPGIAGLSLPGSDDSNSAKAIKKISTLSFFENSIINNIFLPDLMAVDSWNHETNTLTYNESIYDMKSSTWVREYSYPKKQIPSAQESFKRFTKKLSLSEDKKSGFVTLSIKHQSPYIAKEWTELVINEVNNYYRQKDKSESLKAVSYLNKQISMTTLSEIKIVIAELLQKETKKLALLEANQFYVFDYIDPPAVMELKSEPNRPLICILAAILGGVLSILFVIIKHYAFYKKA